MSFAIGVLFFVLGSAVIGLCLAALPGRTGGAGKDVPHDHGSAH
jgi:hypothetical protein